MMLLKVGPEAPGELVGTVLQRDVVDRGLPFAQVVHDEITDGPAGERVTVYQFPYGALAGVAYLPQRRDAVAEDAGLPQRPEGRRAGRLLPAQPVLGAEDLQHVADGDVGDGIRPWRR